MFGENRVRLYIAAAWIVCFSSIWILFSFLLPYNQFKTHLDQIEKSIESRDWKNAKKSMEELKIIYGKKRSVIQMNNASEVFTNFELTIGQLEASVKHEQESAVEYVGAIRSSLDFVMKAFSAP